MAEYGREIPEIFRERWTGWKNRLNLTWADIQRFGGPDQKLAKKIAEGLSETAMNKTLIKMVYALPIEDVDKAELLELINVHGVQRSFQSVSVSWRGAFDSFGNHADQILFRVGLRTREEYQMAANIGLPRIESIAYGIMAVGPQKAADLPL